MTVRRHISSNVTGLNGTKSFKHLQLIVGLQLPTMDGSSEKRRDAIGAMKREVAEMDARPDAGPNYGGHKPKGLAANLTHEQQKEVFKHLQQEREYELLERETRIRQDQYLLRFRDSD